jgi:antitoxin component HigA of HigAB toxin-antitoxin module
LESQTSLARTVRRLDRAIEERGLTRAQFLDPPVLAATTALPESVVRELLAGGRPPDDTVNERVRARIKALSDAHLRRHGTIMRDLAAEVSARTGISDVWARAVCDGRKTPNVELLHHLVGFFGVEGGESFFTAPADEALARVLRSLARKLEHPHLGPEAALQEVDPVAALLDRYGVVSSDLRMHGSVPRAQLERLLEGVLRSVLPQGGDGGR